MAGVSGVKKSKNSSQMKKSKKCVFLHVRGELATNSTQTKKSKATWPKAGVRGGQEIEEFFAIEEIEEMRFSPRTSRTCEEFHANEEIEEI